MSANVDVSEKIKLPVTKRLDHICQVVGLQPWKPLIP